MTRWKSHLPGLQTAPKDSSAGSPVEAPAQSWIDHPRVEDFLRQFVARHRRLTLLRRTGWAATIALGWLLCCCLCDRLFDLPRGVRFVWLLSDLLIPAALILPPLRRLLGRQMDWTAAADQIERLTPVFGQRLQTAASQMAAPVSQRGSKAMLDSILREVDRELEALAGRVIDIVVADLARVVRSGHPRGALRVAACHSRPGPAAADRAGG